MRSLGIGGNLINNKTTVFEDVYSVFIQNAKETGECSLSDIKKLIVTMQDYEMDTHIVIAGQNGTGKSMLELMLAKIIVGKDYMNNFYMADKTTDEIIQFLLDNENTTLFIDELNLYLSYKLHATGEQNHLINMLELARSKRIAMIGCIRDPRKISLNYRDGKMSVLIWVLDRFTDNSGGYAAVFVANPLIEGDDRFCINFLNIASLNFEDMRSQMESLPSFIGYLKIPSVGKHLDKAEITEYKKLKNSAMAHAQLNALIKKLKTNKIDQNEFMIRINGLKKQLGEKVINEKLAMLQTSAQKTMADFDE